MTFLIRLFSNMPFEKRLLSYKMKKGFCNVKGEKPFVIGNKKDFFIISLNIFLILKNILPMYEKLFNTEKFFFVLTEKNLP